MSPLGTPDDGENMAPKSAQGNLVEIKVNVPPELLQDALEMFEAMGLKPGDAHRDAWIEGVQAMAEKYNKVLVNKQLRRKAAEQ